MPVAQEQSALPSILEAKGSDVLWYPVTLFDESSRVFSTDVGTITAF